MLKLVEENGLGLDIIMINYNMNKAEVEHYIVFYVRPDTSRGGNGIAMKP